MAVGTLLSMLSMQGKFLSIKQISMIKTSKEIPLSKAKFTRSKEVRMIRLAIQQARNNRGKNKDGK
jgi:hypothetical protein